MAKQRKPAIKKKPPTTTNTLSPPTPFKPPPSVLDPLLETLDEKHTYILHLDSHPTALKRKVFLVPLAMNLAVIVLFLWRAYAVAPWYLYVFTSTLGYANHTTLIAAELAWDELCTVVARRALTFLVDFALAVFLWPWPYEFFLATTHANPVAWRWAVSFRDVEVVARRSRGKWTREILAAGGDVTDRASPAHGAFTAKVRAATAPLLLQDKTGYLLMGADWELDWGVMVDATTMVDRKMAAVEAFKLVVLVWSQSQGQWLVLDTKAVGTASEDNRREQVLAFRAALAELGKEDLFFRWIEIVQYEATQPGGFGAEKQVKVAREIRELFEREGIDFDEFWRRSTGGEAGDGI